MSRSAAERNELAALLALRTAPGLSSSAMARLLLEHGSALRALRDVPHSCGEETAAALRSSALRERVLRALAVIDGERIGTIALTDTAYPERLRQRLDQHAPPLLFTRGRLELLAATCIAIVGSRTATTYGLDITREIADGVVRAGGCVVSGVALGIDGAAHDAALAAGGATIGVLGCGIDVHYPRRNMHIQDGIARAGLLLSELLPGMPPLRHHFTHRNRIIAALSEAVVVVEAGDRSGAVTTGNHAATLGVRVIGVMNAMHLPQVQGIMGLLRDGAEVYTGVRDLLESTGLIEIGGAVPQRELPLAPAVRAAHRPVIAVVGAEPIHADAVMAAAGLPAHDVMAALLELEVAGLIRALPGQRYVRA